MHTIASIQMVSGAEVADNLQQAARLIRQAADSGANLIVLPENFAHMGVNERDKLAVRETYGGGPIQAFLAEQALENNCWIIAGTIPVSAVDEHRVRAACLIYDARGEAVARYDKMHLFDVSLTDTNEAYHESETIEPGDEIVVVQTPVGRVGIAVCYDLRFPELFRAMLAQGVEIIALPSAFTATTGRAHWEILLRARAIENLCYVVAANQGGVHANGRETYGDSMIIDPWGVVLQRIARGPGIVSATTDHTMLQRLRRNFPALQHQRIFCGSEHG